MSLYPPPDLLFALADDLFDIEHDYLPRLLAQAQGEGRQIAEFNFNITDLTIDFANELAVISDVLDAHTPVVELPIEQALAPFSLAQNLPARCFKYLKQEFGSQWKEAVVWLAGLPQTNQNLERIVMAAVIQSRGEISELKHAVALGRLDWRDLLMNGGLGPQDWPQVLNKLLGPETPKNRDA